MNTSVADRLLDAYIAIGDAAVQAIRPDVMFVLITLAVIGLTWAHLRNALTLRESPINLLIMQFMTVGFFVWLLENWSGLMRALMGGMVQLGLKAGGNAMTPDQFLHPSEIASAGIRIAAPLIDAVGFWGWLTGTNVLLAVSMIIVVFAFFIMSLQVLVAIIEFKLGVVWCFFMVALGIFKGTAFASEKALGYVFASGIKLFALATVVSVGSVLMTTMGTVADPTAPTYNEALGMAFGSLVLAALAWFIPSKVAGVIGGGPSLGAGAAIGTMAAIGATAAVAAVGGAAVAKAASGTGALRAATTGGATRGGLPPMGGVAPGGDGGGSPGGNRGGLSWQMRANPVMASSALETIDRTERAHAATLGKINGGVSFKAPETAEHERAQAYRGLAWDIGSQMQESDPELSQRIEGELDRIEAMKMDLARAGVSPAVNSATLAEEYRNVTMRALNLDGGGGFDTPSLSTSLTPEGRSRNAALASSLGVGNLIRAEAAKGRTTRQIAEGLGDRLSPVNRMAERIGQGSDANLHRMAVVQAYKDEHGIPNPTDAGFKSWAALEKKNWGAAAAQAPAQPARSDAPSWARNPGHGASSNLLKIPASLNAIVPRGAERSAGMTASNTGVRE
ncbi:P-type conjugative transfer protein TrbL [Skermanella sp. TT6]|uniref:P-type conjugative transfer protein TrbL n=1 Tax=Skermanella cutis TaxID=2775420 RepID=A0ABX7B6A6_9PROT|nr:P-type conjugative transfer protein TrbL [Skermanella sp. TT6]QQP89908.1 P-type conjugative transfer protein TrbL [Skermanella sp. TT6]